MNIAENYLEEKQLSPAERLKHTHPLILSQTSPRLLSSIDDDKIVCPFCANTLYDVIVIKSFNGYKYTCTCCNTTFDNLDIAASHFGKKVDYTAEALKLIDAVDGSADFSPNSIRDFMSFYKRCNSQLTDFVKSQGGSWRGLSLNTLNSVFAGFISDFGDDHSSRLIIPSNNLSFSACLPDDKIIEVFGSDIFGFQKIQSYVADTCSNNHLLPNERFPNCFDPVFIVNNSLEAISGSQLTGYRFIAIANFELLPNHIEQLNSLKADLPFIVVCPPDSDDSFVKNLRHACPSHTFLRALFRNFKKWTDDVNNANGKFLIQSPDELPLLDYITDSDGNPLASVNDGLQFAHDVTKFFFDFFFNETKKFVQICFDENEKSRPLEKADDVLNMQKAQQFFEDNHKSQSTFDERNKYIERFTPSITDDDIDAVSRLSKDGFNQLKLQIKSAAPETIFVSAGRSGVVCPLCGSGSKHNGTGMSVTPSTDGGWRYKCWACGELQGDLLEIIATINHLDLSKDFKKILALGKKIVENAYNLNFDDISFDDVKAVAGKEGCSVAELKLIESDIQTAKNNIEKLPECDRRGLSFDTLKKFDIGYITHWIHPKTRLEKSPEQLEKITACSYIIIPTAPSDCFHYVAVMTPSARNNKNKDWRVVHAGKKEPYILNNGVNLKTKKRIIIVEGEIDALSISQALDFSECVIAAGGAAEGQKIIEQLNRTDTFKTFESRSDFLPIIIFDNDDTGIKKSRELRALFLQNGYPAYTDLLVDTDKFKIDANDILTAGGNKDDVKAFLTEHFPPIDEVGGQAVLKSRIEQIIADAQNNLPANQDAVKKLQARQSENKPVSQPESKAENNSSSFTTKDAIPSCPIDLEIPPLYGFDEYNIRFNQSSICYTPVVIKSFLTDVDSGLAYTQLAFYDKMKNIWKDNNVVPNSLLADTRKIISLSDFGIQFNSKTAKNLSNFLLVLGTMDVNRRVIPHILLHNFTGWINNDFKEFIYPSRKINGHTLRNDKTIYGNKFKLSGDYQKWKEKITELYYLPQKYAGFNNGIFLLTFGVALAAPALRILGVRSLQLLLHCSTGKGKSATAKIALSIYGNPEQLKHTFNSTTNAIDEFSSYYNDLPVWIDEFQSANKSIRESIDAIIYNYAEGKVRGRLRRDGTVINREMPFVGTRIMTGEQNILSVSGNAGARNRLLSVGSDVLFPNDYNIADLHRFFNTNYGFFGVDWIRYLSEHSAELKNELQQSLSSSNVPRAFFDERGWADNWIEFFTVIFIVLKHALPLIVYDFKFYDFITSFAKMIDIIADEVPEQNTIANYKRAIICLEDYINSHRKNFLIRYRENDGRISIKSEERGQIWQGVIYEDKSVAIFPSEFKKIIEDDLKFPSADAVLFDFDKEKMLLYNKNSKTKYRKYQCYKRTVPGSASSQTWMYLFKPNIFGINTDIFSDADNE